jgi:Tol biopolymer transport system component
MSFGGKSPYLSPDGEWIYFQIIFKNQGGVGRIRPDGSDYEDLTGSLVGVLYSFQWTPNRDWIVFIAGWSETEIYRMRPDGSDLLNLTPLRDGDNFSLNLSPDGEWIYFISGDRDNRDVYRIRLDGTERENLTASPNIDELSLILEGEWLYFISEQAGVRDIFRMRLDGKGRENLMHSISGSSMLSSLRLSPNREWLVFNDEGWYRMRLDGSNRQRIPDSTSDFWTKGKPVPVINMPWRGGWMLMLSLSALTIIGLKRRLRWKTTSP